MTASGIERSHWELAAESTVVKLRWFGIVMGYILVQTRTGLHDPWAVRAFLALGAGYAALDLAFWRMGEVILKGWPLAVSLMESVFIALLCYHDTGLNSPFRWYYLLSLICCSIRNRAEVAWWTLAFHGLTFLGLAWVLGTSLRPESSLFLTLTIMTWVTWACSSLAGSLREAGDEFARLNAELAQAREDLERRVQERTDALRASQARVIQQEKMAAFGLLAAGIAHEVGNPLAALSSLVQMLKRRGPDPYTSEKLDLAGRQLQRIERTIRELVDFSRPASTAVTRVRIAEIVDEALGIAKYYQRTKQRSITTAVPADLPTIPIVRDYLTQVVLNLVLNAIDATEDQGRIHVEAHVEDTEIVLSVDDDGRGISLADRCRLFQPFFTTKPHGTGLGLFVSRQILEDYSGTLTYRSELGRGSTFLVRLPLASPRGEVRGARGEARETLDRILDPHPDQPAPVIDAPRSSIPRSPQDFPRPLLWSEKMRDEVGRGREAEWRAQGPGALGPEGAGPDRRR
jgi:signal transduction histidine kinase